MISFKGEEGIIFNFRAAAVIIDDEYILLHKSEKDNFWSLPGGRVEFGEKTENTVVRELKEEINIESKVIRQLWYVEDFYKYNEENYHEIGIYYLVDIGNEIKSKDIEYIGAEGEKKLLYKWFKISEVKDIEIYPIFLKTKINKLSNSIEKIVQE